MKKTITTIALATIITLGSTFANAGILVSDVSGTTNDPCTVKNTKDTGILVSDFVGILVSDFTGILVSDFTGILVSDRPAPTPVNCGILVSD